jgi:hypothetical protein
VIHAAVRWVTRQVLPEVILGGPPVMWTGASLNGGLCCEAAATVEKRSPRDYTYPIPRRDAKEPAAVQ